ncbi:hypothetical protein NQ846_17510, partial [Acinetobacter baumannii]|nr:hypothetical protein [Acinetobacter baumannii]
PGCLAIVGGSYIGTNFVDNGSVLLLPNQAAIVGVLCLENCTVEDCEIISTTILINHDIAQALVALGMHVPGIKDYFSQQVIDNSASKKIN